MNIPLKVLSFAKTLDAADIVLLEKLARQPNSMSLEQLLLERSLHRACVWKMPKALVVTQTLENGDGRELFVYGIVGRGMLRVLDDLAEDVRQIALAAKCDSIGGNVTRRGLEVLYERLGATPLYTYYRMEI